MFKLIQKLFNRNSSLKRYFSSTLNVKPYVPQSTWKVWTSDKGTYPLFVVVMFDVVITIGAMIYISLKSPDIHFNPANRHTFFRGDLKGFEYLGDSWK